MRGTYSIKLFFFSFRFSHLLSRDYLLSLEFYYTRATRIVRNQKWMNNFYSNCHSVKECKWTRCLVPMRIWGKGKPKSKLKLIDLLIKRQFSIMILSFNLTTETTCLQKRGFEWTFVHSKLIILRPFFCNRNKRFSVYLFSPYTEFA